MTNKAKKIISLLTIISICQTPLILDAFGIDVGGILTIILTECLMMLLIGFLARSRYWSQDIIEINDSNGAGSHPIAPTYQEIIKNALDNPFAQGAKLNQVAFSMLEQNQKAVILVKFIKKINESKSSKKALNIMPESERVGYIKVLKDALDIVSNYENVANKSSEDEISKSENVANQCSGIEYKFSDYLNMYNFIVGNKGGGFNSSRVLEHQALIQKTIKNPLARGAELNEETFNMLNGDQKQKLLENFRRIIKKSLEDNGQLRLKINKLKNKIEVNEENYGEHSQDRYLKVLLVLPSSTEYKYSDYMKMYGFIDANKKSKSAQKRQSPGLRR